MVHDDSLPHISPVPQPHFALRYEKPSVPDLSVCDISFVVESPNKIRKDDSTTSNLPDDAIPRNTLPRSISRKEIKMNKSDTIQTQVINSDEMATTLLRNHNLPVSKIVVNEVQSSNTNEKQNKVVPNKINMKQPRATKASLARMALNQPIKYQETNNLKLKKSPKVFAKDSVIEENKISASNSRLKEEVKPTFDFNSSRMRNFLSYCPDDYSDMNIEDDESFLLEPSPQKIVDYDLNIEGNDKSFLMEQSAKRILNEQEQKILDEVLDIREDFKSNSKIKTFIKDSMYTDQAEEINKKNFKTDYKTPQNLRQGKSFKPIKINSSKTPVPSNYDIKNHLEDENKENKERRFNWSLINIENGSLLLDETVDIDTPDDQKNQYTGINEKIPEAKKIIEGLLDEKSSQIVPKHKRNETQISPKNVKVVCSLQNEEDSKLDDIDSQKVNVEYAEVNSPSNHEGKTDQLMEIMADQQQQLKELQQQVCDFLNYQKHVVEESANVTKKDTSQRADLIKIQNKQQLQIEKLQEQLQQFLNNPPKKTPVREMSTQYSFTRHENIVSKSVNTSLQWDSLQRIDQGTNTSLFSNHSKENLPVSIGSPSVEILQKSDSNEKCCSCCCNQNNMFNKKQSHPSKSSEQISSNISCRSSSIDDKTFLTQDESFNRTNVTASISPVKEVNISTFYEDSKVLSPERTSGQYQLEQWKSPVLGESASVLVQQNNERMKEAQENVNNVDFCAKIMEQVKSFIEAQDIKNDDNNSLYNSQYESGSKNAEKNDDNNSLYNSQYESGSENAEKNREENGTVAAAIPNNESIYNEKVIKKTEENNEMLQNRLPRINYMTMSSNETFQDFSLGDIDHIASKYLPTNMKEKIAPQRKILNEITNKSLKFQGVYQFEYLGKHNTMTSVNFSCNMSLASQKYLQKYQLNNQENINEEKKAVKKKNKADSIDETVIHKENILDFKKLRNLRKLK